MLCRTASDLYWLSRYVERAENTARFIDFTQRIALLPARLDPGRSEAAGWQRALDALGLVEDYQETHDTLSASRVLHYLIFDPANHTSIYNCVRMARENGRAQRGAITTEMYQELNASWLEINQMSWGQIVSDGVTPFLEWMKTRSAAFRGVVVGTMGRDEGYHFMRMGTFVERADNTVRLLDIKYAQAEHDEMNAERDVVAYYQWSAMLQAISAFETYRKIYRDTVTAARVIDLLIYRSDVPRSLATCCDALHSILLRLTGGEQIEVVRLAGSLAASFRYGRIDDVIEEGMQPFLDRVMQRIDRLTLEIVRQFMTSIDVVAA
ncbi:MAG: alpha-E domain-containing protein [Rudaea sp.]